MSGSHDDPALADTEPAPPSLCATEGHDRTPDRRSCRRCDATAPEGFYLLDFPVQMKAGLPVYSSSDPDARLRRPLVLNEELVTTGLRGEWRVGRVVWAGKLTATVADESMRWFLDFARDDDGAWTVGSFQVTETP